MRVAFVVLWLWLACVLGQVDHVHWVDSDPTTGNMLFRGGAPEVKGNFDWNALVGAMSVAAKAVNKTLPPSFQVLDINVENLDDRYFHHDGLHVVAEKEFFDKNPRNGTFVFWYTHGTFGKAAQSFLSDDIHWLATTYTTWSTDNLWIRVPALRSYLTRKTSPPTVIYLHCDCGCDRTGELMGSYAMQYQGKTWDQVCEWNNQIAGRPQMCPNVHSMQWYCLYLNQVLGFKSTGNCLNDHYCLPVSCMSDRK